MTKSLITAMFIFIILSAMTGCDIATEPLKSSGVIKGIIRDSVNGNVIEGVTVSAVPFIQNAYTDTAGYFMMTGVGEGKYMLAFSKQGYINRKTEITVSRDTARGDAKMFFADLFVFSNRVITSFNDFNSLSQINLFSGAVVNLLGNNYDMTLIDSQWTSSNHFLCSANYYPAFQGYQMKFSHPLLNPSSGNYTFTKRQFDTLSKYYTPDGNIDQIRDFTEDRTLSFNETPNMPNYVYAFWLKGRNLSPPVYGMFYLNYSFVDTIAQNQFKLIIDVKVNRSGLNLFNPNE